MAGNLCDSGSQKAVSQQGTISQRKGWCFLEGAWTDLGLKGQWMSGDTPERDASQEGSQRKEDGEAGCVRGGG